MITESVTFEDNQAGSTEKAQSLPRPHPFPFTPVLQKSAKRPPSSVHNPPPQHPDSPVQEGIAKGIELSEGFFWIYHQGIPRNDPLHISLHYCYEGISGRLRPNPHAWEILFQQVPAGKSAVTCRHCACRWPLCVYYTAGFTQVMGQEQTQSKHCAREVGF